MRVTDLHQRYHGVYLGQVVSVDDPEGLGRIRLDTDQLADTSDDPVWAVVARPLAGNGPTIFFTPRVGDQVLLSYMQGDPRQPVVLGYAHHQGREPDAVGPRKHAIHTGAGTITFDEGGHRLVIELGATRVVVTAGGIAIEAGTFTINGARVMVEGFLGTFGSHTHKIVDGSGVPTGDVASAQLLPPGAGAPNTTER